MHFSALSLVVLSVCIAVLVAENIHEPSGFVYRENSIQKPYLSGMSVPFWDFSGHAVVSDEYIRLTPDRQAKRGAIWNSRTCSLPDWEVTVQFRVHGQGKSLFGDGFAIWYAAEPGVTGGVFGSKDHWSGLGLFFDTYGNLHEHHAHGHPYVSAVVNDGTIDYDHDSDGTSQQLSGCQSFFRNVDYDTYVRILYRKQVLKVMLDTKGTNTWTTCFLVKDLSLPTGYFFGLSASTGDLADNHDILSFKVSEAPQITSEELQEENSAGAPIRAPHEQQQDGHGHDHGAELPDDYAEEESRKQAAQQPPHGIPNQRPTGHHQIHRDVTGQPTRNVMNMHQQTVVVESSSWFSSIIVWIVGLIVVGGGGYFLFTKLTKKKESKYNF